MDEDITSTEKNALLDGHESSGQKEYLQTMKGISLGFASVILFTSSATSVQLLQRRIPDFELNAFRFGPPLLLYLIPVIVCRKLPTIERDKIGAAICYILVVFVSAFSYFVSISLLPAGLASSIQVASGILSALILFSFFWEEKFTWSKLLFAATCLIGVAMVAQPGIHDAAMGTKHELVSNKYSVSNLTASYQEMNNFSVKNDTSFSVYHLTKPNQKDVNGTFHTTTAAATTTTTSREISRKVINFEEYIRSDSLLGQITGHGFAVIAGSSLSLSVLITKRHPSVNDNFVYVIFWSFTFNSIVSIILMLLLEQPTLPSNWFDTVMLIIHSLTSAGIWPLYIYAPKFISGNTFSLIVSTEVVFMLLSQYTVLSSVLPGHRNWIEVLGVILVLLGSSLSSVIEIIKTKRQL